jgi:hypothetical protein
MIRTALLTSLPLLMIGALAQATPIYDFGTSLTSTACGGSASNCTGGMAGTFTAKTGVSSGMVILSTTPTEAYTDSPAGGYDLIWSGTGTGTLPTAIPVYWDFTITDSASTPTILYYLQVTLDGVQIYKSATATGTSGALVQGSTSASTSGITGTTSMGAWSVDLHVSFASVNGTLTTSVPLGSGGIQLGDQAPEPATWGFAGCGLLIALTVAARRARRPTAAN